MQIVFDLRVAQQGSTQLSNVSQRRLSYSSLGCAFVSHKKTEKTNPRDSSHEDDVTISHIFCQGLFTPYIQDGHLPPLKRKSLAQAFGTFLKARDSYKWHVRLTRARWSQAIRQTYLGRASGEVGPKTRKECQLCSNLLLVSPVRLQYIITLQVFLAWESIIWKIFRSSKCSSDLQTQKMSQSSVWCFYWYTRFSNYTPENYKLGAKNQIENHLPNKPPWLWIPAVHFPGCIRACWWLLNFNTADWESWPYCASLWFSAASSVTLSAKDGGKHRQLAQVVS